MINFDTFQKLWAVCDLAISLLFSKTTNFELKEFPASISLSLLYFKVHPEGENFVNGNVYIPQELVYQPPKKAGASLFLTRKGTASALPNSKVSKSNSTDKEDCENEEQNIDNPEPVEEQEQNEEQAKENDEEMNEEPNEEPNEEQEQEQPQGKFWNLISERARSASSDLSRVRFLRKS